MITETANAKINLTLSVGKKRFDGYHDIDTVMHSISLADTITLTEAEDISLTVVEGEAPLGRGNLMVRAAELFMEKTGLFRGVAMTLAKRIPTEAGMGGGSSDAAAVLRGLSRLYHKNVSRETLAEWGALLGADIPFCVYGGAARCRGIGEEISPLRPWEGLPLIIVRPPVSVSTGKAYSRLDSLTNRLADLSNVCEEALDRKDRSLLAESLSNDFEAGLFPYEPMLKETDAYLHTTWRPHLMTGSGSAFFVLARDAEDQHFLTAQIATDHPGWYVAEAETVGKQRIANSV